MPSLCSSAPTVRPGVSALHQESRELFSIDFCKDGVQAGDAAVGDPLLFAVENVVRAVGREGGAGTDVHGVGAGTGLGERVAADPLARGRAWAGNAASAPRCRTTPGAAWRCRCARQRPWKSWPAPRWSVISVELILSMPMPPYSSGMSTAVNPSSAAFRISRQGARLFGLDGRGARQYLLAGKLLGGRGDLALFLVQVFRGKDFGRGAGSSRKPPPAAATIGGCGNGGHRLEGPPGHESPLGQHYDSGPNPRNDRRLSQGLFTLPRQRRREPILLSSRREERTEAVTGATSNEEMGEIGPVPSASIPARKDRTPGALGCGANSAILRCRPRRWGLPQPSAGASSPPHGLRPVRGGLGSGRIFAGNVIRLRKCELALEPQPGGFAIDDVVRGSSGKSNCRSPFDSDRFAISAPGRLSTRPGKPGLAQDHSGGGETCSHHYPIMRSRA